MTTFKYFSGNQELSGFEYIKRVQFAEMFPGVKGVKVDSFSMLAGRVDGVLVPVTRTIEYKSNPSLHKCDGRCLHAKGRSCECACGGKNHGIGG